MRNFDRDNRNDTRGPRFEKKGFGGPKKFGGSRERSFDKPRFGGDRGGYGASRSFDKPMMHSATCSECGKECQVPFKPNGRKPIFCSTCFEKQGNGGGGERSFERPRFGDREERGSFRKENGADTKRFENLKEQFDQLNRKLDRILKTLGASTEKTSARYGFDVGDAPSIESPVLDLDDEDTEEEQEGEVTPAAAPKKKGYPKKAGEKKNKGKR